MPPGAAGPIALLVREVDSGAAKRQTREKLPRREIDVVLVCRLNRRAWSVTDCWRHSRNWNILASVSFP